MICIPVILEIIFTNYVLVYLAFNILPIQVKPALLSVHTKVPVQATKLPHLHSPSLHISAVVELQDDDCDPH